MRHICFPYVSFFFRTVLRLKRRKYDLPVLLSFEPSPPYCALSSPSPMCSAVKLSTNLARASQQNVLTQKTSTSVVKIPCPLRVSTLSTQCGRCDKHVSEGTRVDLHATSNTVYVPRPQLRYGLQPVSAQIRNEDAGHSSQVLRYRLFS